MEILGEILLQIALFILRIFAELLLQLAFELLGELAIHFVKETFQRIPPMHPAVAALGYAILGALAGAFSVWVFPWLFLESDWAKVLNLVVTPLLAGMVMAAIGAWRLRRERDVIRLETFAYGYCFALAMGLVRFIWGA